MTLVNIIKKIAASVTGISLFILSLAFFVSCSGNKKSSAPKTFQEEFTAPIEKAHNRDGWKAKNTLKTNIKVTFGGNTALEATLFTQTNSGKTRLEIGDTITAAFDGHEVWVSPNDSALSGADFQVFTWPYFLAAPMKLNDPGTQLSDEGIKTLRGKEYDAAKLTFKAGTGETPDDWYMLYRDRQTDRLHSMAYVVTYGGKTLQEANKEPHAITYQDFQTIDGIPISTTWKFWAWNKDTGLSDQQIGEATLSNTEFVTVDDSFYAKPKN